MKASSYKSRTLYSLKLQSSFFLFLNSVFWDLKTCSSVVVYQLCRITCCFHHHDAGSTPKCQPINHLQSPIIYPDHEGSMFLQKSVFFQTIRRQISEDSKFHSHRCQVPTRLTGVEKMCTLLLDRTAKGKWPSFCLLYSSCYLKKMEIKKDLRCIRRYTC